MKEGSIVVMVEPIENTDRLGLLQRGFGKWPEPGDTPMVITEIVKLSDLISGVGVALDLYPEIPKQGLYFDIGLFREILPPNNVNIAELIQSHEPVEIY